MNNFLKRLNELHEQHLAIMKEFESSFQLLNDINDMMKNIDLPHYFSYNIDDNKHQATETGNSCKDTITNDNFKKKKDLSYVKDVVKHSFDDAIKNFTPGKPRLKCCNDNVTRNIKDLKEVKPWREVLQKEILDTLTEGIEDELSDTFDDNVKWHCAIGKSRNKAVEHNNEKLRISYRGKQCKKKDVVDSVKNITTDILHNEAVDNLCKAMRSWLRREKRTFYNNKTNKILREQNAFYNNTSNIEDKKLLNLALLVKVIFYSFGRFIDFDNHDFDHDRFIKLQNSINLSFDLVSAIENYSKFIPNALLVNSTTRCSQKRKKVFDCEDNKFDEFKNIKNTILEFKVGESYIELNFKTEEKDNLSIYFTIEDNKTGKDVSYELTGSTDFEQVFNDILVHSCLDTTYLIPE